MLCADCKKNVAVIYINKIDDDKENAKNEVVGLCAPCAKKRGIDPFGAMAASMNKLSPEDMQGLSKQFENLFANIDMDKLSNMFDGMDFPGGSMELNFTQDGENSEAQPNNAKVKVKGNHNGYKTTTGIIMIVLGACMIIGASDELYDYPLIFFYSWIARAYFRCFIFS